METEDIHARMKQSDTSKFLQGHKEQGLQKTKVLSTKWVIT
jgi:hypothetical protein